MPPAAGAAVPSIGACVCARVQPDARDLFMRLLTACHSVHGRVKSAAIGAFCAVMREVRSALRLRCDVPLRAWFEGAARRI
jgi:hypothetical protein